jgi:hypothetical protein
MGSLPEAINFTLAAASSAPALLKEFPWAEYHRPRNVIMRWKAAEPLASHLTASAATG